MTAETTLKSQENDQPIKKDPQTSFAEVRKMLETERSEKLQMQQRITELERASKQKAAAPVSDDDEYSSEPYVDPKTLNKKLASMEAKFESLVERKSEEKARSMIEEEKRISYLKQNGDFDQTMQPEVVQKFAEKFPTMAEAILRMPDGFDRQRLVYEAIKNTGSNKKEESSIQKTIDANKRSPYYAPSGIGSPPASMQGDFSPAGQKNAYDKLKELKGRLRLG